MYGSLFSFIQLNSIAISGVCQKSLFAKIGFTIAHLVRPRCTYPTNTLEDENECDITYLVRNLITRLVLYFQLFEERIRSSEIYILNTVKERIFIQQS